MTSSKRTDTLLCNATMRKNTFNFLYIPGHVTLWCLEIIPQKNTSELAWAYRPKKMIKLEDEKMTILTKMRQNTEITYLRLANPSPIASSATFRSDTMVCVCVMVIALFSVYFLNLKPHFHLYMCVYVSVWYLKTVLNIGSVSIHLYSKQVSK